MSSVMKATPRLILGGIQDLSGRVPVAVPELIPTHLPLIPLLLERGPTEPQIVIGTGFNQTFGSWSLDVRSKFCNHATMLARRIMQNANMCMIQRILPPNARSATLRVWLEVCPASIPLYVRDSNGAITYDSSGLPVIQQVGGNNQYTVGHRLVWHAALDPMGPAPVVTATANQALTGSGATVVINTVTVAAGNRVRLTGQTNPADNGLYKLAVNVTPAWTLVRVDVPVGTAVAMSPFRAGTAVDGSGNRLDGLINIPAPTVTASANTPLTGTTPLTITTTGGPVVATNGLRVALGAQTTGSENGNYVVQITGANYALVAYTPTPTSLGNSTCYPIADFQVSSEGEYGNRVGLRLTAPNALSGQPGDVAAMNNVQAYMYRFSCVERPQNSATPLTVETLAGEPSIDLTLKDGTVHPIYGNQLSVKKSFISAWENTTSTATVPMWGPFGKVHLYRANIDAILELLCEGSATLGTTGEGTFDTIADRDLPFDATPENRHLLNIFTGVDQYGVPYYSLDVNSSVAFGGKAFGDNTVLYAENGNDGLAVDIYNKPDTLENLRIFDGLVGDFLGNFGDGDVKYLDDAKYPLSTFWDSGYSLNTKKLIPTLLGRRKDLWVALATQAIAEYADPQNPLAAEWNYQDINTATEETSIGRILSDVALLQPESEIFGTRACRAIVVRHADYLLDSEYDGILPFTLDVAHKISLYCGAGSGIWNSQYTFTESPNNQVQLFGKANVLWRTTDNYDKDWDAGLIWVQNYNRRAMFYPAWQTVYPDDTSVLNSLATVMACVELNKVALRTWRDLTGDDKLTNEQFVAKSNRLIEERIRNRFDGRFVFQVETFYTALDEQRGFSYTCKVHIGANNAKTVGQMSVVAHRMSDLILAQ